MGKKARSRRDKYHGWRLYWQGCPDPFKRARMIYRGRRHRKANARRDSFAAALWTVFGVEAARRYLVRRGWHPSLVGPSPATHRREASDG